MNHSTNQPIDLQTNPPTTPPTEITGSSATSAPADHSPGLTNPVILLETYVRQHPGGTLLAAAGLGLLGYLVARALTPPPTPRNRAVRLLEDIQHRLAELAQPAYDRVAGLADDGAHAFDKGVHNLGSLHLDRKFNKLSRGFMSLFQ